MLLLVGIALVLASLVVVVLGACVAAGAADDALERQAAAHVRKVRHDCEREPLRRRRRR